MPDVLFKAEWWHMHNIPLGKKFYHRHNSLKHFCTVGLVCEKIGAVHNDYFKDCKLNLVNQRL
jgi:hypothetical protein